MDEQINEQMIQQIFIVIKSVESYILILDEQINERINSLCVRTILLE